MQSAGGTTSFGSLLSANGGAIETSCSINMYNCGGYGGYDGMNYGGTPMIGLITESSNSNGYTIGNIAAASRNGGTIGSPGLGYGAGGGVSFSGSNIPYKNNSTGLSAHSNAVPGKCGSMTMGIFDLTANQSISCTVGTSSKPTIDADTILQQIKKNISTATSLSATASQIAEIANAVTAGTAGVVYVEFLG